MLVGVMGFLDRGGLLQAACNMAVVLGFLLLITRRMPSKTEEYNAGNIFSHVNIMARPPRLSPPLPPCSRRPRCAAVCRAQVASSLGSLGPRESSA